MSTGLPELPITCLLYQEGSDDIIYAGTDVGVYRWDKTIPPSGCWVEFNDGKDGNEMPHTVITDMDIDYCNQKLVVNTWGRGVWETDLYEPGGTAVVIPPNTTVNWNSSQYPKGDIVLGINSTLNITGTYNAADDSYSTVVYMPKLAAIYADYGSKSLSMVPILPVSVVPGMVFTSEVMACPHNIMMPEMMITPVKAFVK